jgi:2-(1,2-epoxy-1,2-dihydrophenyl)acetyl-CoA isomerase
MTYECIEFGVRDGVAAITFNMPQYGNALTIKGVQETLDALQKAEGRQEVGAIVLTGRGRAFCSGFNLKEIPSGRVDDEATAAHFRVAAMWWHQVLHLITRIRKPVLAAVNGVAVGSGLGMTLCADMAVCTENARFLPAWHTIGLANDATTSYSLAKIVGFRRALEWILTNRTVGAREAMEMNLVNRV